MSKSLDTMMTHQENTYLVTKQEASLHALGSYWAAFLRLLVVTLLPLDFRMAMVHRLWSYGGSHMAQQGQHQVRCPLKI